MKQLSENDEEAYQRQFHRYIDAGIKPDGLEAAYTKAHAAIRADPTKARDPKELGRFGKREKPRTGNETYEHKKYQQQKISNEERKAKVVKRLAEIKAGAGAEADEADEE